MLAFKILLCFNVIVFCYGQSPPNAIDPIDEHIERPCDFFDKFCIRQFFAQHAHCTPVDGAVPDPLYRDKTHAYLPHANTTFISTVLSINNLNGRIQEFFINRVTNKLVLTVAFSNLLASARGQYLRYHRRAQEPIVLAGSASLNYGSLSLTIVIPNLKDLQLQKSEVFGYVGLDNVFVLSPELTTSGDPGVTAAIAEILAKPQLTVPEILLADGPFYIGSYIQYNLCDFGLFIP